MADDIRKVLAASSGQPTSALMSPKLFVRLMCESQGIDPNDVSEEFKAKILAAIEPELVDALGQPLRQEIPASTFTNTSAWPAQSSNLLEDIQRACEEIRKLPPVQPLPVFAKIVDWLPRTLEDGTVQHWTIQFGILCLSKRAHEELMKLPEGVDFYSTLRELSPPINVALTDQR
jgi:hypothetical protein